MTTSNIFKSIPGLPYVFFVLGLSCVQAEVAVRLLWYSYNPRVRSHVRVLSLFSLILDPRLFIYVCIYWNVVVSRDVNSTSCAYIDETFLSPATQFNDFRVCMSRDNVVCRDDDVNMRGLKNCHHKTMLIFFYKCFWNLVVSGMWSRTQVNRCISHVQHNCTRLENKV